ncbi:MAG TPA: hypothetical protein VMG63_19625 [Terriglobia bacterium]|nr:hypothetical protein [Terriglobia bacterium]
MSSAAALYTSPDSSATPNLAVDTPARYSADVLDISVAHVVLMKVTIR